MGAQERRAWKAALRSGDYQQGQQALRRALDGLPDAYCCLGVAAELHADAGGPPAVLYEAYGTYSYDGQDGYLSNAELAWLGITNDQQHILVGMNDNGGSFADIADTIDEWYPGDSDEVVMSTETIRSLAEHYKCEPHVLAAFADLGDYPQSEPLPAETVRMIVEAWQAVDDGEG